MPSPGITCRPLPCSCQSSAKDRNCFPENTSWDISDPEYLLRAILAGLINGIERIPTTGRIAGSISVFSYRASTYLYPRLHCFHTFIYVPDDFGNVIPVAIDPKYVLCCNGGNRICRGIEEHSPDSAGSRNALRLYHSAPPLHERVS